MTSPRSSVARPSFVATMWSPITSAGAIDVDGILNASHTNRRTPSAITSVRPNATLSGMLQLHATAVFGRRKYRHPTWITLSPYTAIATHSAYGVHAVASAHVANADIHTAIARGAPINPWPRPGATNPASITKISIMARLCAMHPVRCPTTRPHPRDAEPRRGTRPARPGYFATREALISTEHHGERVALWRLEALLERILTAPFAPEYRRLVDEARDRLCHRVAASTPRLIDRLRQLRLQLDDLGVLGLGLDREPERRLQHPPSCPARAARVPA